MIFAKDRKRIQAHLNETIDTLITQRDEARAALEDISDLAAKWTGQMPTRLRLQTIFDLAQAGLNVSATTTATAVVSELPRSSGARLEGHLR